MKKISFAKILILAVLLVGSSFAYAQSWEDHPNNPANSTPPSTGGGTQPPSTGGGTGGGVQQIPQLQNPLRGVNSVTDLLIKIVDLLIFLGVIVAVFMFIFVGFKFVWARGNPEDLVEARKMFLWVAVGTAILISSKVIVEVIKTTFISAGVVEERLFNRPN